MGTESSTTETKTNGSSIIAGVSSLVVLIVIIVMVTSLLNNKNISTLETRATQIETDLQSLRTKLSTSLKEQLNVTIFSDEVDETVNEETTKPVISEIENNNAETIPKATTLKQNTPLSMSDNQDTRLGKLENQLETFTKQLQTVTSKVNSFTNKLNQQANSLKTTLKNEAKVLAKTQNDKVKKLETLLKSVNKDIAYLQREGKNLKVSRSKNTDVNSQVKVHDSTIKTLTLKLQDLTEQATNLSKNKQQLEQKIDQQIEQLKSTLETNVAKQFKEQNDKITSIETQLQMLIGGLIGSTEK
ncbi:hypothetical protein QUF74_09330 [Candidatus Halobeggiatoa sp. HSG11]|nr:hypothetical protein [Candidatus Halobeggiatoa sp. HSG11]